MCLCVCRYSFRVPPRLDLRVRPMLGEREVTFTHVTEWIERKLQCEFQVSFTPLLLQALCITSLKLNTKNFHHQLLKFVQKNVSVDL